MSQRFIYFIALWLFVIHLQLEAGTWINLWLGEGGELYIRPFLDKNFNFYGQNKIALSWWVKAVSDDWFFIFTYALMAKIAFRYSEKLYLICIVFLLYHVFDHFMLWYNYKTTWWLYIVELIADAVAIFILLRVKDKKQAIVKSLI